MKIYWQKWSKALFRNRTSRLTQGSSRERSFTWASGFKIWRARGSKIWWRRLMNWHASPTSKYFWWYSMRTTKPCKSSGQSRASASRQSISSKRRTETSLLTTAGTRMSVGGACQPAISLSKFSQRTISNNIKSTRIWLHVRRRSVLSRQGLRRA